MSTEEVNYKMLFDCIYKNKGISGIWKKVLEMLAEKNFESTKLSDPALQVLCIYFSLLDDGNTCICLDNKSADFVWGKWEKKWKGLEKAGGDAIESSGNPLTDELLDEGIQDLFALKSDKYFKSLFSIDEEKWLFAKKYDDAREPIREKINVLFSEKRQIEVDVDSISYPKAHKEGEEPPKKQIDTISEGMKRNLIITGGPGTGKTTVIYYVLKNILRGLENKGLIYNLYLTAPSGKAADRLGESIRNSLSSDTDFDKSTNAFRILNEAKPFTIHRLLGYSPQKRGFTHDKNHPFAQNSIFVIDEASMIDICLFRQLLEAIDDRSFVFILGDNDQLPSVDAGAVLGDILKNKDGIITLDKSFRCHEIIWDAAKAINAGQMPLAKESGEKGFSVLKTMTEAEALIDNWYEKSACIPKLKLDGKSNYSETFETIKETKILCAERRGPRGVESINNKIRKLAIRNSTSLSNRSREDMIDHFPGEQLIITRNIPLLDLYNGDNGLVVQFEESDDCNYLMIEKGNSDQSEGVGEKGKPDMSHVFDIGGFRFIPLNLIPSDCIELAYAITIHKSQGSGYSKVLIIMPEKEGHPLLNRQILYTAITRAADHAYLLASDSAIQQAVNNKIIRDTKIEL